MPDSIIAEPDDQATGIYFASDAARSYDARPVYQKLSPVRWWGSYEVLQHHTCPWINPVRKEDDIPLFPVHHDRVRRRAVTRLWHRIMIPSTQSMLRRFTELPQYVYQTWFRSLILSRGTCRQFEAFLARGRSSDSRRWSLNIFSSVSLWNMSLWHCLWWRVARIIVLMW